MVTSRTNGDYRQATLGAITGAGLYVTNASSGNTYGLLVGSSYTHGDVWLQASRTDGTVSAYNISLNASGGTVTVGTVAPQSGYNLTVSGAAYLSGGLSVYDGIVNNGAHGSSFIQNELPASNNGAGTGRVVLRQWCSEPGVTWAWAGFGYNVSNDNGSPEDWKI